MCVCVCVRVCVCVCVCKGIRDCEEEVETSVLLEILERIKAPDIMVLGSLFADICSRLENDAALPAADNSQLIITQKYIPLCT